MGCGCKKKRGVKPKLSESKPNIPRPRTRPNPKVRPSRSK